MDEKLPPLWSHSHHPLWLPGLSAGSPCGDPRPRAVSGLAETGQCGNCPALRDKRPRGSVLAVPAPFQLPMLPPRMCGHIPWTPSPSHGLGLPGAAARDGTGLDPDPAGRNFPQELRVPFPSTDCTDTNFILQILKTRSRAPPAAPTPALPVAVSSCGAGFWGPRGHRGFVPWAVSPRLPEMQRWLGHQPVPPGWAVPAAIPGAGGDSPGSGQPLPPSSHQSKQCRSPAGMGTVPSPRYQPGSSSHPTRGCGGTAGTAGTGDSGRLQGRGWRGELWGSAGLRTAWARWGHTAAGARWTGRSWPL